MIVSGPQNQTLPLGGTASLLCVVSGQPTPDVYWFKNDRVLPSVGRDPRVVLLNSGTLQISGTVAPISISIILLVIIRGRIV